MHEIAVMKEKADCLKNRTSVISGGYFRITSTKSSIDLIRKLKINSVKWEFTVDYDITWEKHDIRESC
jgi:hypothetical protein